MSFNQQSNWRGGFGRGAPVRPHSDYNQSQAQGFYRPTAESVSCNRVPDTQPYDMDLEEDLLAPGLRARNNSVGRLTAHVAPVTAGLRPDYRGDQQYGNDFKPARFSNPSSSGSNFQPPRRPPASNRRYADDDWNSSRYDRADSRFSDLSGGLLGDVISEDRPAVKPEQDIFKAKSVARNPSPDRSGASGQATDSYRNSDFISFDRQRNDNYGPNYGSGARSFPDAPPGEYQQRDPPRPNTEVRVRREDPRDRRDGPQNFFDRSMYPAKGAIKTEETRPKPAVYELPKIPKRDKGEDELNEQPEEKIVRLRVEHAKLEMRIQSLEKVVESTAARELDIRRQCQGSSLADNQKFSDTVKLLGDAKRQLEQARLDYGYKDDIIKKLMQKPADKSDKSTDSPKEPVRVLATDFLDEKREERVEQTDNASKLEFFDGCDHWCQQCNYFATSIQMYLAHLHSDDHWAKNKANATAPWPLIKRATSFDQDRSLAAIRGTQFLVPCHAYYCAICKVFLGDSEAGEEHLFSISHNKMIQRFFMSKPEYEHVFNKDKLSAKSKQDAEIRKQKREAEDRRLRDEEAKKKAAEEDNKKREMEIRERLMEENKHVKRMRDIEDKRERERLRKDRDRLKEKERERERRKRKGRIIQGLSSDEEVLSSDSEASKPAEDLKLKMPCFVGIGYEEAQQAFQAFERQKRSVFSVKTTYVASSLAPDAVWTAVTGKKPAASATKVSVTADFSDNSNDEFSLASVTSKDTRTQGAVSSPGLSSEKDDNESPKKLEIVEVESPVETTSALCEDSESRKKQDSPMEELILNALSDCLTPPVVLDEESMHKDEPPAKKHKKNRDKRIEVITGDDPHNDEDMGSPDAGEDPSLLASDFDDAAQFPSLSLEDLVTKSP